MEIKAYFSDIHKIIIEQLEGADSQIQVAVAWFTDKDIFDVLCKKAQRGIKVSVVLIDDDINRGAGRLNFVRLENLGAKVTFLPKGSQDAPIMHHKFCIVDGKTIITGSYNWSKKARSNDENITVITDSNELASEYLAVFDSLWLRVNQKTTTVISSDSVKRRLEMIRNLILLGDYEDVNTQIGKLNSVAGEFKLTTMIHLLKAGQYQEALEIINSYLTRMTALVLIEDHEVPELKFQLKILELRLESLSNEKTEIERCLIVFNQRHNESLGDLIQGLLEVRAQCAKMIAQTKDSIPDKETAEAEAEEAEQTYQRYSEQHEQLQKEVHIPELNNEQEKEHKAMYKKACGLCHPDKVPEDKKQAANEIFLELRDAYQSNDLKRVAQIYERVKSGNFSQTRSSTLSKVDVLKSAISEIKYQLDKLLEALYRLQASAAVQLMQSAGKTEVDWQTYFDGQAVLLVDEFEKLKQQLGQLENGTK